MPTSGVKEKEKDRQVLTILFHRYARLVRTAAYRILGDWCDADDIVQQVFLSVYSKITEFDFSVPEARFWLVQTACECAVARRRPLTAQDASTTCDCEPCLDTEVGQQSKGRLLEPAEIEFRAGDVCSALESLGSDERRILELYFCQGYTLDQIARELGRSRENVRHNYFRSLEKLRKEMFSAHVQASV